MTEKIARFDSTIKSYKCPNMETDDEINDAAELMKRHTDSHAMLSCAYKDC